MGLRFHKSIKLCKGVKLNISKTGPSLTLGGKGLTMNVGKNGVYGNASLSGTGLSYRQKLIGGKNSKDKGLIGNAVSSITGKKENASSENKAKKGKTVSGIDLSDYELDIDESGSIHIFDKKNHEVTDPTVLRKIRSTEDYKIMKAEMEENLVKESQRFLEEKQAENENFLNLHRLAPEVTSAEHFVPGAFLPRIQAYERQEFEEPAPDQEELRAQAEKEAEEKVSSLAFWTVAKKRKEYVENILPARISAAEAEWKLRKLEFEAEQDRAEAEAAKVSAFDFDEKTLREAAAGDTEAISDLITDFMGRIELPVEIHLNYEFDGKDLLLDLDLPEIEDIPATEYTALASGAVKEKPKTQLTIKQEYITLVYGLAIFLASNLYGMSPVLDRILISAYTQRRDKTGNEEDTYIYSIRFNRNGFIGKDWQKIIPADFCQSFENRAILTSTGVFKKIDPYAGFAD